jgi:hypothetical protein
MEHGAQSVGLKHSGALTRPIHTDHAFSLGPLNRSPQHQVQGKIGFQGSDISHFLVQ